MNFDFKAQLSLLKKKKEGSEGYIKYKDIIEEKLKQNKEEPILKQKKEDSDIDDITQQPPIKKRKISETKEEKIEVKEEKTFEEKADEENDITINDKKKKKEYTISIIPSEIIKEVKEQDTTKRVIYPDDYSYDFKCEQLYNWFHLTFLDWEKELEELILSNAEDIKAKIGQYKQCRGYIKTLLVNLKEKKVTKVILDKLFQVMVFLIDRDYIRANDNYIELSIGNAPWPMGVTMVGIHERSGRSKIYTSQVAYILNDDITKKYLQSVKRVMSFIQRRYPQCPSKCVFS